MSAARDLKPAPKLRGDLAGMAEALAEFAKTEYPQAETAQPRVAVLVPCFNEEAAVATVVADFRKTLPSAEIALGFILGALALFSLALFATLRNM